MDGTVQQARRNLLLRSGHHRLGSLTRQSGAVAGRVWSCRSEAGAGRATRRSCEATGQVVPEWSLRADL
ncbi:hypothetical protein SZMC14600_00065, partial [Saccharomonospora azurea SZMC 14600]